MIRISTLSLFSFVTLVATAGCGTNESAKSDINSGVTVPGSVSLKGRYAYKSQNGSRYFGSLSLPYNFAGNGILEGSDEQSLILSQKRVWEFSKLENGDLKIEYTGRISAVFADETKSCIFKKVN